MILKTGFGYYVKDGKKTHKFELDPSKNHPDPEGFTVVEVANKFELEKIILDKSPEQIAQDQKSSLKSSGKEKLKAFGFTHDEIEAMIG